MNPSRPNWNIPQERRKLLVITVLISLLLIVWALGPYLWDRYRVVSDTQNYYWMARAQDPTLFPIDNLYISSWLVIETNILGFHLLLYSVGLGWGLFFYLASVVVDYIWLAKGSVFVLGPLCVIYLFKTGRFLRNSLTGMSLSLIFIFFIMASPLSLSIASGLQRSFAIPLLVVFLYYLIRRQYVGAAVMLLFSTLIYLPNFPPMFITYALSLLKIERPFRLSLAIKRIKLVPVITLLLLSALVVAVTFAAQRNLLPVSRLTPPTANHAQEQPTLAKGLNYYLTEGPTPMYIGFPFLGRAGLFDTGADTTNVLVMLILGVLIYKTVGPRSLRRMPVELWYLLAAGFIMYALSLYFMLGLSSLSLYLPSRYTRNTLFLIALFFVGLNWVDFLQKLPGWLGRNIRLVLFFFVSFALTLAIAYLFSANRPMLVPTFWLLGLMLSAVLTLLGGSALFWLASADLPLKNVNRWAIWLTLSIIVVTLGTVYIRILGLNPPNPPQSERDIYEFVSTLPKETMLAGDPSLMTNIPLFSRRSVLFRKVFPEPSDPIIEYFDAQYAETPQTILTFCQRYQVDYLVIDTEEFAPRYLGKQNFFHNPWNDIIVEKVAGRSNFIVPQLQPVFASDPYKIIKCDADTLLAGASSK